MRQPPQYIFYHCISLLKITDKNIIYIKLNKKLFYPIFVWTDAEVKPEPMWEMFCQSHRAVAYAVLKSVTSEVFLQLRCCFIKKQRM